MRPRERFLIVTCARPEFARRVAVSRRWDIGRCDCGGKVGCGPTPVLNLACSKKAGAAGAGARAGAHMIKFEKYELSVFTGKKINKFGQKAKILEKNKK
mgnify:CR=1 FL=1